MHFEIGRTLQQLGRVEEARDSFQRAIDLDVCPLRALPGIGAAIEKTAVARQVPLIDFDSILAGDCLSRYGHNSPGSEYFLDHVHPTVEAHRLLALSIINAMARARMVTLDRDWGDESVALASRRIESRVDPVLQSRALTNLAQVLSWAGKQEEAGPIAEQANRLRSEQHLDDDPESVYYAAIGYALKGLDVRAIELLQRVVVLQPENCGRLVGGWRRCCTMRLGIRSREPISAKRFGWTPAMPIRTRCSVRCWSNWSNTRKLSRSFLGPKSWTRRIRLFGTDSQRRSGSSGVADPWLRRRFFPSSTAFPLSQIGALSIEPRILRITRIRWRRSHSFNSSDPWSTCLRYW